VRAITGRTRLGFTESGIVKALEDAARKSGGGSLSQAERLLRSIGFEFKTPSAAVQAGRAAVSRFADFCFSVARAPISLFAAIKADDSNAALLATLNMQRPDAASVRALLDDSAAGRRRAADSDDEGDDDTSGAVAAQYRDKAVARTPVLPDPADFPTRAILGEKPPMSKLHGPILSRRTKGSTVVGDGEIVNDPVVFPAVVAKRSHGGAATLLRALPPNFVVSATSGRAMAVAPLDRFALSKRRAPAHMARDEGVVGHEHRGRGRRRRRCVLGLDCG
jgi:hypothetical protein